MRRIKRWTTRLLLVLFGIAAFYVGIVTYPTPLFAYSERHGSYRIYSDEPLPSDLPATIADLDRRLAAMEHAPPDASQRIYLCGPKRFELFAFLLRKGARGLAIGLSVANETFVSVRRMQLFSESNGGVLRHTRFEGNLAEAVAHEVAHFNSVHALGYRAHLSLPTWKSEGWAEYQANLAAIRADPGYDLGRRIDLLLDDDLWSGSSGPARHFWEAQLLVEFLGEVEGYRLRDLVRDGVTEAAIRARMMAWYRSR